jgi:XTP/dITP diphosphohydrolase
MDKPLLVVGTANRKKGRELADLLEQLGLELRSLADFPNALAVEESGSSFAENAVLKATKQARHLSRWVVADDSGLLVDALGGEPGVRSARYSGPEATDASNNRLLLANLADVPPPRRGARFFCHIVLADPTGAIRGESEGWCCGRIRLEAEGSSGFGYDPLFEVLEYHRTFGALSTVVKSVLSHRARAARAIIPQILRLVDSGQWTGSSP